MGYLIQEWKSNQGLLKDLFFSLYKYGNYHEIKDLRWFLYSNRGTKEENLPPTMGSLYLYIEEIEEEEVDDDDAEEGEQDD